MDNVFILNENSTDTALSILHDAVCRREPGRPEAALSPDELLSRFRAADPTRNAACLPWLLRTYAAGGYRLEDLSKAQDTLVTFARLRGQLPNTDTIDGETRNPRKLGSHTTLASLWNAIAPLVDAESLAQENEADEQEDTDRERALSQSRVLHRSNRMVVAVPLTEEASCWWGQGTRWCTAARNNNAFQEYHKDAPLIVVCLRKSGDLPARKLQLHVHAGGMQFMDENDARVSPEFILERWRDLETLFHWAVNRYELALAHIPEHLRTEAICLTTVDRYGYALGYVPEPLRTEAICTAAVGENGRALHYIPEPLRTEAMCLAAVGSNAMALFYVPEYLRTEAICITAVMQDARALTYVPEPLRTETICTVAVDRNGLALEYVPKHLRTEAACTVAVGNDGLALAYVPKHLRTEAICTVAVDRNRLALAYVPRPLRTEAIYTTVLEQDGWALACVPKHLRTEAICTTAVEQNGFALSYVPKPLRTKAICLAAVGRNGHALAYVPKPLRTEAICTVAVGNDGQALRYVPYSLRTEVLCLVAIGNSIWALECVPKNLRTKAIIMTAVDINKYKSLPVYNIRRELHDLELASLEDYLENLQPIHQEMAPFTKEGVG